MPAKVALPRLRRLGNLAAPRTTVYVDFVRMRRHDPLGGLKDKALSTISGQFKNRWVVTQQLSYWMMTISCFLLCGRFRAALRGHFRRKEMPARKPFLFGHELPIVDQNISR
jgi:hypothetical protein